MISCKPLHTNVSKEKADLKTKKVEPQIAFYFFKAIQDTTNGTITVTLINQKIVKGMLKSVYDEKVSEEKLIYDNWLITFSDLSKQNNLQLQISNPLVEHIEYINEENTFERKEVRHQSKEFVIRIPNKGSIKTILFEKISKKNINLIKIPFQNIKI